MSLGDAKGFEADDVSLPPPDEFEVIEATGAILESGNLCPCRSGIQGNALYVKALVM